MAWGMGGGLACSRITETILSRYTHLNEETRSGLSSAAFFAPSIYHLIAGNRGLGILESATVRRLNGVFAAGFIADLGFMGVQSAQYGDQASYQRWVNHRASALRDAEEGTSGIISLRSIAQLIAPEISSWYDTVDGLDFHRNQYYQRILEADRLNIEKTFGTGSSH
jgi:hypothetical protein